MAEEDIDALINLLKHRQRTRLGRFFACAGITGTLRWAILCLAVFAMGLFMSLAGEWALSLPSILIPAMLMFLARRKLVDWWRWTGQFLNVLAMIIVLGVLARPWAPFLTTDAGMFALMGLCSAHASAYFWTLSDPELAPRRLLDRVA
jgi:hypothetical protein